jgi:hypothetical protein
MFSDVFLHGALINLKPGDQLVDRQAFRIALHQLSHFGGIESPTNPLPGSQNWAGTLRWGNF